MRLPMPVAPASLLRLLAKSYSVIQILRPYRIVGGKIRDVEAKKWINNHAKLEADRVKTTPFHPNNL